MQAELTEFKLNIPTQKAIEIDAIIAQIDEQLRAINVATLKDILTQVTNAVIEIVGIRIAGAALSPRTRQVKNGRDDFLKPYVDVAVENAVRQVRANCIRGHHEILALVERLAVLLCDLDISGAEDCVDNKG